MVTSLRIFMVLTILSMLSVDALAQQNTGAVPSRTSFEKAAAQQDTPQNVPAGAVQAENAVEKAVRRFRVGIEGGVALDPELVDFGAHAAFGPIFKSGVDFRPGFEFGLGEVTTLFGINLDVLYTLPGSTVSTRWTPYVGAGPNFALSHRSIDTTDDPEADADSRFDFSDTDFVTGFNFIAGVRSRKLFFEMKATAYGVSTVRLLGGFNF